MSMEETQINAVADELQKDGYIAEVAEALANRGITVASAQHLTKREVLEHYLEWNGICGYADVILDVLDNAEANCNM